jgi:hypothetical protein
MVDNPVRAYLRPSAACNICWFIVKCVCVWVWVCVCISVYAQLCLDLSQKCKEYLLHSSWQTNMVS